MRSVTWLPLLVTSLTMAAIAACGGVFATAEEEGPVCRLHESQACVCAEGGSGIRYCRLDEEGWGSCHCDLPDASSADNIGDDAGGDDAGAGAGDAAGYDAAQPGADAAISDRGAADGARPDTLQSASDASALPDLATGYDATPARDSAIPTGVGVSCNDTACTAGLLCVGDPGAYFCRLPCTLGGGQCNPVTEHCIELNGSTQRACVPGVGLGASCSVLPCADLYVCVSSGGGYVCVLSCDPDAADPGCPYGTTCQGIGGLNSGGCI